MAENEKELREKITQWQKEGKAAEQMRKRRNHILIQLGAVTLGNIRIGKLDPEEIIKDLPKNKQKEVRDWLNTIN